MSGTRHLRDPGKREWFARLIARGVSNAEACRVVGVNARTGKRWRLGRTITSSNGRRLHYPPVVITRRVEISPRYLSEDERVTIADLHRRGCSVRAIAEEVGRNPATISRELRRNRDPGSGQYRPFTAQRQAVQRRARPGRGKLINDSVLHAFVAERLKKRWSPEQIAHALRVAFPDERERRNMELFSPVGPTREIAIAALRRIVDAILDGDTARAGTLLEEIQPESPDNTIATVASCIGIVLGLLDDWLSGRATDPPASLAQRTALPSGHWNGERAATDILVLARKARATRSLDKLLTQQGGPQVLAGSALALAAAIDAWTRHSHTPPAQLIHTAIR